MTPEKSNPFEGPNSSRAKTYRRILLLFLFIVIVSVVLTLAFRGGRDFKGDLAQLLPANTAALIEMRNMEAIAADLDQTLFMKQLRQIASISEIIMDEEDLEELHQNKIMLTRDQIDALISRFSRRWFGEKAILGLFPLETTTQPAFVLITKTRAGFEENLAELVTSLLPDARAQKTDYRGVPLVLFKGKDPNESISYCRFGKTVAVSFLNDSLEPLQTMIDRRIDGSPSLAGIDPFRQFTENRTASEGISLFVHVPSTFPMLEGHPKLNFAEHQRSHGNLIFLRDLLAPHEHLFGQISHQTDKREMVAQLHPQGRTNSPPSESVTKPRIPSLLPSDALFAAHLQSSDLPLFIKRFTFGFPKQAEIRQEAEEWNERFLRDFGLNLEQDIIPLLDGELGATISSIMPELLFFSVHAAMVARIKDPDHARQLLARAQEHYQSRERRDKSLTWKGIRSVASPGADTIFYIPTDLPGGACLAIKDNYLCLATPFHKGTQILQELTPSTSASPTPVPDAQGNLFQMKIEPSAIAKNTRFVLSQLALWDDDAAKDLAEYGPYFNLMEQMGGIELRCCTDGSRPEIKLTVPLH